MLSDRQFYLAAYAPAPMFDGSQDVMVPQRLASLAFRLSHGKMGKMPSGPMFAYPLRIISEAMT